MTERDPYRVLGLRPGATAEEMKRAYRILAKKYHPDSSGKPASGMEFSKVVQAYRTLMIEERRRRVVAFPAAARRPSRPQPTGRWPSGGAPAKDRGHQSAAPSAGTMGFQSSGGAAPPLQPATDVFKMGRLLLTARQPALRAFAARALGNCGRKTAYAFLRKALLDSEETVVRSVVSAIGKLSIMQSAGELAALYTRSGIVVRRDILLCIGSILPRQRVRTPSLDGFTAIAQGAAKDADPEIRSLAARLLRDGE